MERLKRVLVLAAGVPFLGPPPLCGQAYRLQLESRVQSVAYRGVQLDSVPAADVVVGPSGGFRTADGFAATCLTGRAYCTFYRPGPRRHGGPLVTTADVAAWDLGTPGLSLRGTARVGFDIGDSDVWPGTEPAVQVLEGYLEYARPAITVQAGRLTVASRFGYTGFDGGRGTVRLWRGGASASLYGGWGLARAVALPVTSPALDPLDEFQPERRQIVVGGDVGWTAHWGNGRVRYERQIDPDQDVLVSERVGGDVGFPLSRSVRFTAGLDYDLASGWVGSAEAAVAITPRQAPLAVTLGGRRYRPHFDLWTIWGAFSPVPYHAGFASVRVFPRTGLQLHADGEVFRYADAEAGARLSTAEHGGWRVAVGGRYAVTASLVADLVYHLDKGVGGRSLGVDASATWTPRADLRVSGRASRLQRALEFRFSDAGVWLFGGELEWRALRQVHAFASGTFIDESRDRSDAAGFSWNQVRLVAGLRLLLNSAADRIDLPPAILQIPEGGSQ